MEPQHSIWILTRICTRQQGFTVYQIHVQLGSLVAGEEIAVGNSGVLDLST